MKQLLVKLKESNQFLVNIILSFFFISFIFGYALLNFLYIHPKVLNEIKISDAHYLKDYIYLIESTYNENLTCKDNFIEIYGLTQRILMKNVIDDFELIKDNMGYLHLPYEHRGENFYQKSMENLLPISQTAVANGAYFLYVIGPSDLLYGKTEFYPAIDCVENNYQDILRFVDALDEYQIPYLNTHPHLVNDEYEDLFYRTDHHWALPATFKTAGLIVDELNSRYDMEVNYDYLNLSNYETISFSHSFLGSAGIKVGRFYAGKDNFKYYNPIFPTNIKYQHFYNHQLTNEKTGTFRDALINEPLLADPSYYNKYNAFLYGGYAENRIYNLFADNEYKCLVFSDSFSRQMVPYLSLCFSETRYLDPQPSRYNNSYIEYIKNYKPDVVIVLFNSRQIYYTMALE